MPANRRGYIHDGVESMCVLFGLPATSGAIVQAIDGIWTSGTGSIGGDSGQCPSNHIRGSIEDAAILGDAAVSSSRDPQ